MTKHNSFNLRNFKFFVPALGGLISLMFFFYWLINNGHLSLNTPNSTRYAIRGIDVSHHNQNINWKLVAQSNVKFAYIKATEGGDFIDKKFNENMQKAQHAGIITGAYHFFTFCRPALDQLDNFSATVPVSKGTLPPVIDFEFGGNCKSRPKNETILKELDVFTNGLEKIYGQKPILYVTQETYKDFIENKPSSPPIWIRSIFRTPKQKHWVFWQYNARGRIPGITTFVDLNVFNGNETELKNLVRP